MVLDTTTLNNLQNLDSVPPLDDIINIAYSFIFWNVINYIVMCLRLPDAHLKRNDMLDMRNRIVSCLHGVSMLIFAGYHMYFQHSECGAANTRLERNISIVSCGYFLYDFVAMAYYRILDKGMFIHHNMCVLGFIIVLS